jgi:hypothetical protein
MRIRLLLLLLTFSFGASASFDLNPLCKQAYEAIFDLRFDEGMELIRKEKALHPENRITALLENYRDMLLLVVSEERDKYPILQKNKPQRLAFIEEDSKDSPWFLYCKAEINLQWAFVEVKFGDLKDAAVDINKSYKQLESNEKKFPGFVPAKKCMGLLHTLIGNIPGSYKWAADIIGMKGSVKQGLAELNEVMDRTAKDKTYAYLRSEALFYISFIEVNLENNEQEKERLASLFSASKFEGPLLTYAAASLALHSGKGDKMLEFLDGLPADKDRYPFQYLGYLKGVALMNKLDTNASAYFKKYIADFKGINFIRSAYRNLAWCELLKGNEKGYRSYMELAVTKGNSMVDEDKQALKEAKAKEMPEVNLLKARLLFDGGYYPASLTAVLKMEPAKAGSVRELIEFEYRLARIHHKLNELPEAMSYYELAVERGEKYPYYFAANSALQLGLIYETKGDKVNAKRWFEKCLSMKDHEYQDSIELKAKAGLSRVE